MTIDQLILGTVEGDETVLSYLDSLSNTQLEALFAPMFNVTRPVKSLKDKDTAPKNNIDSRATSTKRIRPSSEKQKLQARLETMSPTQRALLEGLL